MFGIGLKLRYASMKLKRVDLLVAVQAALSHPCGRPACGVAWRGVLGHASRRVWYFLLCGVLRCIPCGVRCEGCHGGVMLGVMCGAMLRNISFRLHHILISSQL